MSVRRSSITDLSEYIKKIMRSGTPHKGRGWPTIAQLPGDIKNPDQPFKPNLVAYQVLALLWQGGLDDTSTFRFCDEFQN